MEIKPILSSLKHHKTSAILVAAQVALTLAIVVNSVFMVGVRIDKMGRDTGMDIDNIFSVYVRGFGPNFNVVESIDNDIRMIRELPGIIDATVSNHVPLSGSGSGTGLRTVADDTIQPVGSGRYRMSEHGINALGVNLIAGRNFEASEVSFITPGSNPPTPAGVLVTQALADALFPDENALGKTVYWGSMDPSTIIGIIEKMHGSWVGWDKLEHVVIQPGRPAYETNKYIIRAEPGELDRLMVEVEEKLAAGSTNKIIRSVRSLRQHADRSYQRDRAMMIILVSVIGLLLIVTSLVFFGLASFKVKQNTKIIGVRRALGARQADILRYFMFENWLITTIGVAFGTVLTLVLAYFLETEYSLPRLDMTYIPIGIVCLWLLGQLASYLPAKRAAGISPAIATRSV